MRAGHRKLPPNHLHCRFYLLAIMTESVAIKAILSHDVTVGASVTVKGCAHDALKGGFAFIHIHDGSCLTPFKR